MKVRNGFVSNSSSSSFVCNVCGENASGMDMGLTDAEMFECKVGHVICDEHFVGDNVGFYDLDFEEKRAYCLERVSYEPTQKQIKEAEFEEELDDLYSDEIDSEDRYETPVDNCPCCTLDSPNDSQILEFLFADNNTTREDVATTMKHTFGNYKKMCEELKI